MAAIPFFWNTNTAAVTSCENDLCKKKCEKSCEIKIKMKSNYNKIEYYLGSGFELFSASTVSAVCQDCSVLDFSTGLDKFQLSIVKRRRSKEEKIFLILRPL